MNSARRRAAAKYRRAKEGCPRQGARSVHQDGDAGRVQHPALRSSPCPSALVHRLNFLRRTQSTPHNSLDGVGGGYGAGVAGKHDGLPFFKPKDTSTHDPVVEERERKHKLDLGGAAGALGAGVAGLSLGNKHHKDGQATSTSSPSSGHVSGGPLQHDHHTVSQPQHQHVSNAGLRSDQQYDSHHGGAAATGLGAGALAGVGGATAAHHHDQQPHHDPSAAGSRNHAQHDSHRGGVASTGLGAGALAGTAGAAAVHHRHQQQQQQATAGSPYDSNAASTHGPHPGSAPSSGGQAHPHDAVFARDPLATSASTHQQQLGSGVGSGTTQQQQQHGSGVGSSTVPPANPSSQHRGAAGAAFGLGASAAGAGAAHHHQQQSRATPGSGQWDGNGQGGATPGSGATAAAGLSSSSTADPHSSTTAQHHDGALGGAGQPNQHSRSGVPPSAATSTSHGHPSSSSAAHDQPSIQSHKPSLVDKVLGTTDVLIGKVSHNPTMVEEGRARKTGTAPNEQTFGGEGEFLQGAGGKGKHGAGMLEGHQGERREGDAYERVMGHERTKEEKAQAGAAGVMP